jgi:hypothetical protein
MLNDGPPGDESCVESGGKAELFSNDTIAGLHQSSERILRRAGIIS